MPNQYRRPPKKKSGWSHRKSNGGHNTYKFHSKFRNKKDYGQGFHAEKRCERTGKIKYRNKHTAEKRLTFEKRILGHDVVTVHHCTYCNAWHLTHVRSRDIGVNANDKNYGTTRRYQEPYNRKKMKRKFIDEDFN